MKTEFNLSAKLKKRKVTIEYKPSYANYIKEDDVKEFIKRLKEWYDTFEDQRSIETFLKEEAGDKLI